MESDRSKREQMAEAKRIQKKKRKKKEIAIQREIKSDAVEEIEVVGWVRE